MTSTKAEALLEPMAVGRIQGHFFVPDYQRGYRWGRGEVQNLLDDIKQGLGRPYYLQPIVVKRLADDRWELVDGQQRLTTLFLIMQYMKHKSLQREGANYTVEYETRPDSAGYLEDPHPGGSQLNIDFFHIYQAYRCIDEWFEAQGLDIQVVANDVYGAFFKSVQVIWYEAPDDVDANALFRRLNVGRIPLTDAELVKALLLSRAGDRAEEIAAQWDSFERDLREPEVWAFATGRPSRDSTHIDLLLDSLAGAGTVRDRSTYATFNALRDGISKDPLGFWNDVVAMHGVVLGWYADRDLFHKIGFLVAEGVATFGELLVAAQDKSKSAYGAELDGRIRDHLKLTTTGLRDLTYQSDKTARVLLLMNVETIRQRSNSFERYSFSEHATGQWSLEHIHAQSAENILRSKDQWRAWLQYQLGALEAVSEVDPDEKRELLTATEGVLQGPEIKETVFQQLAQSYARLLSLGSDASEDFMHSISNLALLNQRDNSALSNSVFAVKRAEILKRDSDGSYVPVCTRNVFLKYYSPADQHQMHFWSSLDRQ
jgi:hypothetical protein